MMNSFRKFPEVAGWLYTEHHDVINEWNGYWKFDRSEKFTGIPEIFEGMKLNDFHSSIYLSTGGEICQTVQSGEKVKVPLFISSMTSKNLGNELTVEYELSHVNGLAEESLLKSSQFNIEYEPWTQRALSPLNLSLIHI